MQLIISGLFAKVNFFQPNRKLVKKEGEGGRSAAQESPLPAGLARKALLVVRRRAWGGGAGDRVL